MDRKGYEKCIVNEWIARIHKTFGIFVFGYLFIFGLCECRKMRSLEPSILNLLHHPWKFRKLCAELESSVNAKIDEYHQRLILILMEP